MDSIMEKEDSNERTLALINEIDAKIIELSGNRGRVTEDDFRWAFQQALSFEEYLRTFKDRLAASATAYAPAALAGVGAKAATGDTRAAKLIFDLVGVLDTKSSGSVSMTQVTVNVPTLRDIEEGKTIDV